MKKAVVIGGGIGGLAVAIRLAATNWKVTLFEKNNYVGGKLAEFTENGYRFDMGPSLFTMPEYFEDLFLSAGKNLSDYLQYRKLDKSCTYFFPDGKSFIFYHDKSQFKAEAEKKLGISAQPVLKYLESSKKMYEGAGKLFIENSLHKASTYFSKQAIKSLPTLINLGNLRSLNKKNKKYFKADKWVQLFNRYATYNGSSPYKTPAMMGIIPHLEHNIGTFFPEGGMYAIVKAVEKLAIDLGVDIRTGQLVEELVVGHKKIKCIIVDGNEIEADLFVSNMDVALVYQELLNLPSKFQKEIKKERSSSGLVFYWGINKTFPELSLHNIIFSDDYKKEFDQIFDLKEVPTDPTIYINITSKEAPTDAPKGCENWFVMINTPAGVNFTEKKIAAIRKKVIAIINNQFSTDIEKQIVTESRLTPDDIDNRTMSLQGALYGTASNSAASSFTRHSNFSKQFKNLYFVGGTVHPGGGIPLCLNSAKIVVDSL